MNSDEQQPVIVLAQQLTELHTKLQGIHTQFLHEVRRDLLPGGAAVSRALERWHAPEFTFNILRDEARKTHRKGDSAANRKADKLWDMPLFERNDWDERLKQARNEHAALSAQIATAESEMNKLVYALYGLSSEQIAIIEEGHPLDYTDAR